MNRYRWVLKYNPNQPRVPVGDPRGGQWIDTASSGIASVDPENFPLASIGGTSTAYGTMRDALDPRMQERALEYSVEENRNILRDLVGEAEQEYRRILSDDRFVIQRDTTMYFGGGKPKDGMMQFNWSRHMTDDPERAARYGEVRKVQIPKGTRIWKATVAGLDEYVLLPGSKFRDAGGGEWTMVSDGSDAMHDLFVKMDRIDAMLGK